MSERNIPYIVREVIEPRDDMRHLPKIVRYIKHKVYGSPKPWRWTDKLSKAHVFTRRENAQNALDAMGGGELVRAELPQPETDK